MPYSEYRKKPGVISAAQWTDPYNPPAGLFDLRKEKKPCCPERTWYGSIPVSGGKMRVALGDYVVEVGDGTYWSLSKDIFEFTYEPNTDQG